MINRGACSPVQIESPSQPTAMYAYIVERGVGWCGPESLQHSAAMIHLDAQPCLYKM